MQTGSKRFPPAAPAAYPVITFSDQITLHINGGEIHGIHFPSGHTDGDTVYFYPQANVVQTGDDFVNFDLPIFPPIDMDADGSGGPEGPIALEEYVLAHANDDVKIVPGHGNLETKSDVARNLAFLKGQRQRFKRASTRAKPWNRLNRKRHWQN